jgi:hypothetical protein
MREITSFKVDYKNVQGWHVFTSEALPGLYVASEDPERAYDDVAGAIALLVELDTGIACQVTPELPFAEFVESHRRRAGRGRLARASEQRPQALASQRYALVECA